MARVLVLLLSTSSAFLAPRTGGGLSTVRRGFGHTDSRAFAGATAPGLSPQSRSLYRHQAQRRRGRLAVSMNYYTDLGLQRGASIEEVKAAFRSQAMECHPDVDGSPKARERYEKITKAYREIAGGNREDDLDIIDLGLSVGNIAFRTVSDIAVPLARDVAVPLANLTIQSGLPFFRSAFAQTSAVASNLGKGPEAAAQARRQAARKVDRESLERQLAKLEMQLESALQEREERQSYLATAEEELKDAQRTEAEARQMVTDTQGVLSSTMIEIDEIKGRQSDLAVEMSALGESLSSLVSQRAVVASTLTEDLRSSCDSITTMAYASSAFWGAFTGADLVAMVQEQQGALEQPGMRETDADGRGQAAGRCKEKMKEEEEQMTALFDSIESAVIACRTQVTDSFAEERRLQHDVLRLKSKQDSVESDIGHFEEKLTLIFSTLDSAKSAVPDCVSLIEVKEKEFHACKVSNESAETRVKEMEGKRRHLMEQVEALLQADLQDQEAAAAVES